MADISNQLIKDSYNNVVQVDPVTGEFLRIGGDRVENVNFLCGTTISNGFRFSDNAQSGYLLSSDSNGNASWIIPPGGQGSSGTSGSRGTSGSVGTSGSAGSSGANGTSGSAGSRGTSGSSGSSGENGTSGSSGANGTGMVKGGTKYIAYFDSPGSVDSSGIFQKTSTNFGIGTASPNGTAILHLESKAKGFLPPVMNENERDGIDSPATGLMIYCTNGDNPGIHVFDGNSWRPLAFLG